MDGFGPGFLENRKDLIAAVTLEDLKGVAKHMLNPENLIISIVGTPALQPPRTT
jgi:zinc protease